MGFFRGLSCGVLCVLGAGIGCGKVSDGAPNGSAGTGSGAGASGDAGISSGAGAAGTSEPSPRLVPWQLQPKDAPALQLGIYDTREHVHCQFGLDEAGELRCLPLARGELPESSRFADAACLRRLFVGGPLEELTSDAPPFALPLSGKGCEPVRHSVGRMKALPPEAKEYTSDAAGKCVEAERPSSGHRATVEVIPSDRYAIGKQITGRTIAGRLRTQLIESEEQRFTVELVDDRWGKRCELMINFTSAESRCAVSTSAPIWPTFTDARCEAEEVFASDCDSAAYIETATGDLALGERYTGPLYQNIKFCEQFSSAATEARTAYYTAGEPLTDATIVPEWAFEGSGSVRTRGLRGSEGEFVGVPAALLPLFPYPLLRENDESCHPVWTPEGKVRCVPEDVRYVYSFGIYSDDACEEPAFDCTCPSPPCACDQPVIPLVREQYGESHAESLREARSVRAVYSRTQDGKCVGPDQDSRTFRAMGAELSWDRYPELVELNGRPHDAD